MQTKRSVYYWRTTYRLSPQERGFLDVHRVACIYLHYFDVSRDESGSPMPVATLSFCQKLPSHVEVIPTVFIEEDCMRSDVENLAHKVIKRILQMSETNDVKNVHEVQIDCDYTLRSRRSYYSFLKFAKQMLVKKGIKLSVTIRLHQLSMPVPPVDKGVLMLYNTGNIQAPKGKNSILDYRDVEPYLKYLKNYSLPLLSAYPNFSWSLLYSQGSFKAFLHGQNLNDRLLFKKVSLNTYVVVQSRKLYEHIDRDRYQVYMNVGDTVKVVRSEMEEIRKVKQAVEAERNDLKQEIIVYHLCEQNIKLFSADEYEEIYRY